MATEKEKAAPEEKAPKVQGLTMIMAMVPHETAEKVTALIDKCGGASVEQFYGDPDIANIDPNHVWNNNNALNADFRRKFALFRQAEIEERKQAERDKQAVAERKKAAAA